MFSQIVTHTPLYVWAILAFLIYRGVILMRTRDVEVSKLFIIPGVMLALSLFDIAGKFGFGALALAAWLTGAAAMLALVYTCTDARVAPSPLPGHVVMRGSKLPLASMMAIFVTKYVTSIVAAVNPQLRHDTVFIVVVCVLFGMLNGYFFGRLARDLKAYQGFAKSADSVHQAI